eukprot:2459392-Pyramimonas_sp.AAC.1
MGLIGHFLKNVGMRIPRKKSQKSSPEPEGSGAPSGAPQPRVSEEDLLHVANNISSLRMGTVLYQVRVYHDPRKTAQILGIGRCAKASLRCFAVCLALYQNSSGAKGDSKEYLQWSEASIRGTRVSQPSFTPLPYMYETVVAPGFDPLDEINSKMCQDDYVVQQVLDTFALEAFTRFSLWWWYSVEAGCSLRNYGVAGDMAL